MQGTTYDPACNVRGIRGRAIDDPRKRTGEDRVRHGRKCAGVVDNAEIRVELAIKRDIRTSNPEIQDKRQLGTTILECRV